MSQRFLTPPEDRRICETKREPAQVLKHQELRHLRRWVAEPELSPSPQPASIGSALVSCHSPPVTEFGAGGGSRVGRRLRRNRGLWPRPTLICRRGGFP